MKAQVYSRNLGRDDFEGIVDLFHETIVDTNRSYGFFVDWQKVKERVEEHKVELNIWSSLIGTKAFSRDLSDILRRFPDVVPTIPILLALRDKRLKVIRDFIDEEHDIVEYDFSKRSLTEKEILSFVDFFDKTGLRRFFEELSSKSIPDYVTGVEVGMDTHARKNRSGDAMELAIRPLVEEIVSRRSNEFQLLFQKKFKHLQKFGVKVPTPLQDRKADFLLVKRGRDVINIEVNFYAGTGSKPQEIVDSYINRQSELHEYGLHFVWVTDGDGWKGQKNQIKKGFQKVDYLLNLHFCRQGLLETILAEI